MSQFIETMRIENGQVKLIDYHTVRLNETRKAFYCADNEIDLKSYIKIPENFKKGIVKCKVEYAIEILDIHYSLYIPKNISTLKLMESGIDYTYKSVNRMELEMLQKKALPADDVLIVKNGKISDTSFSNIIFYSNGQWYTPDSPLLEGVQREFLLNKGLIEEIEIRKEDLKNFDYCMLINAMLPFDSSRKIEIQNLIGQ